jgi:hypothetical protein
MSSALDYFGKVVKGEEISFSARLNLHGFCLKVAKMNKQMSFQKYARQY